MEFRPQVAFLPQVPVRGTAPVLPQKVSERYLREQAALKTEGVAGYASATPV